MTLIREAESIWSHHGVRLKWLPPESGPDAWALRVFVVPPSEHSRSKDQQWGVGEIVPVADRRAMATAFSSGAKRVLEEATRPGEPVAMIEHRLGVVLGRAVAHEIGHYLLNTPTHARTGLMRASVDAREFSDLRDGGFYLDRAAATWISQQPDLGTGRVSYSYDPATHRQLLLMPERVDRIIP